MKTKQAAQERKYKHRETLTWRGLTYRYDKTYGFWRLVDKPAPRGVPTTVMEDGEEWEAGGYRATSPIAALEGRNAALVALRTREAREANETAKSLRAEVRRLRSKNFKT